MKQLLRFILFSLLFTNSFLAQAINDLDDLQNHYEAFEYSIVIKKSQNLLAYKERFSDSVLIKIYAIKAAAHYAMGDKADARKSFIELLKIDENFNLSNVKYSPKLVELFNNVKQEFTDILQTKKDKKQQQNLNSGNKIEKKGINYNNPLPVVIVKSLALPGWGHLHLEDNTKGWILTSASVATLGSLVYFIFDSNNKEKSYLSEVNSNLIQEKYNKYNSSYKIRNALIVTYAAIWLYTQIDILFFSNELGSKNISPQFSNNILPSGNNSVTISFQVNF